MYPEGFQTVVSVPGIARCWEGMTRPTHFQGVATVVAKLLCLIKPAVAFFGQKDYQQAALIQRLTRDLNIGCTIVVFPTVREPDGLALSSRNVYLSRAERAAAPVLYRGLMAGAETLRKGTRSSKDIIRVMAEVIAQEPKVRIDYLAVCHPVTLESLATVRHECVLLGAVRLGTIRLIDNLLVTAGPGLKHRGGKKMDSGGDAGRGTLGHQKT